MERYALGVIYERLRSCAEIGDLDAAVAALQDALGLELPGEIALAEPRRCASRLRYRGFKAAELVMLAANLKPIVKFEDLPIKSAQKFIDAHQDHYALSLGEPYYKDYLLMRSRPTGRRGETQMTFLYASRDQSAEQLRALEGEDPLAIIEAGRLLGFPSCCAQAFAERFAASRLTQDTVNDDAVRALLAQTHNRAGAALLDPLSDYDQLAFYPCGPRCEHALTFAETTFAALQASAPQTASTAENDLGTPVLFWRMPFFFRFDGHAIPATDALGSWPAIRYTGVELHTFPDPAVQRIQRLFGGLILPRLDRGDLLQLEGNDVAIYANGMEIDRIQTRGSYPPVLGLWQ